ncbi:MAG: hypothetical protein ACXWV0_01265 [Flavisolibacter sp.]
MDTTGPRDPKEKNTQGPFTSPEPEKALEREGGDDNLADSSPTDNRSDEKVIVNEQRENKTVNAPSQTAAYTSGGSGNDEEII